MATKHSRKALTLTLEAPATPSRVVKSAQSLEALSRQLDHGLTEESFTLVINNFDLRAELRAQDDRADAALGGVLEVARNPAKQLSSNPRARDIAQVLAKLADDFREYGPTLGLKGSRQRITLTPQKAKALKAAAASPIESEPGAFLLRGNTEIRAVVIRVGRRADGASPSARVVMNGKTIDLLFADAAMGGLLEALKSGAPQSLTVSAVWETVADGSISVVSGSMRVLSTEPAKVMSGAELLKSLPKLSQAGFDTILEALRESREQDD